MTTAKSELHKGLPDVTLSSVAKPATPPKSSDFKNATELTIMSDTNKTTRKVDFKSSMKVMDIASAKRTKELLGDKALVHLGFIHGFANDLVKRTAPDGSAVFWGLAGQFEMLPNDTENPVLRSSILYLSPDAHNAVTKILENQKGADGRGQVTGASFIYAVSAEKGGTWKLDAVEQPLGLDPLEETRNRLMAKLKPAPAAKRA